MMWENTPPRAVGWYLCAWAMGDGYVYEVAKWDGNEFYSSMTTQPDLFQEIESPEKQWKKIDQMYADLK